MVIAEILAKRRAELGLTLDDIAKQVGVSEATVQRWESGKIKNLRHERIVKLAKALKMHPSELMGWTDEPTKKAPALEEAAEALKTLLIEKLGREPTNEEMQMSDNVLDGLWKSFKK